ncbi:chemotaxis protein CheX [Desulfobacter vibrioformis]|uniref:chemotaxis protein CheX n=1 Tax=Desulfobacter vibrioformis TaxID=34031 RepID=UPI00055477D5|nr:chemotaxis protein CheX [Desulfobacter vibrioformis]
MDVKYINPFITASINVFFTFSGIESKPGRPTIRTTPLVSEDINGFISLNGHGISGYFIINFSQPFLTQILAAIFDYSQSSLNELQDLAGELTNMITGSAKAELSQKGFFFDVAVPQISQTIPPIPKGLRGNPIIVVPFNTKFGKFQIQASLLEIAEDFQKVTPPEIKAPPGYLSVADFAKLTRVAPIKVRRLLKTGFLRGEKISATEWYIPEKELLKIQGDHPPQIANASEQSPTLLEESVSLEEFSRLSGLPPTKIKNFLRTGFIKGVKDENQAWWIKKEQVSKFKKI